MNHGTIEPLNEKSQIAQEYGLLLADVRQQRGIVLELSISNFSEMSNKLIICYAKTQRQRNKKQKLCLLEDQERSVIF